MSQPVFAPAAVTPTISNRNGQSAPFNIAQAVSSLSSTANNFQASSTGTSGPSTNPNIFKAPAHKHAHHLHTIPPREKSTRTLIIDHMLWVHGRTRFAQARSELGMTDRTGGPSSQNYTHRRRPENYEEEDEVGSDGENADNLKAQVQPDNDDEDARIHVQDLQLARNLRLRAEGLEKVVTSMLVQTPPVHPHHGHDFGLPTSPRMEQTNSASGPRHQHTLPNGVRLRLALATLVNDFFARQAPPPPFRHKRYAAASAASSPLTQAGTGSSLDETPSSSCLPSALISIAPISAYTPPSKPSKAPDHSTSKSTTPGPSTHPHLYSNHPPNPQNSNSYYSIPHSQHQHTQIQNSSTPPRFLPRQQTHLAHLNQAAPAPPHHSSPNGSYNSPPIQSASLQKKVPLKPSHRTKRFFLAGTDPETANAPPSFRCPRHLHAACEICVEAKSKMGGKPPPPTRGRSGASIHAGAGYSTAGAGFTDNLGASTSSGIGQTWNSSWKGVPIGIAPDGGGVTGWQDGSGIGSGLLKPALGGSVLRRKTASPYMPSGHGPGYVSEGETDHTGSGYTKLSELVPRFLRLSALVAAELGRELKEGRDEESRSPSMGDGSPERVANRHGEGGNETFSQLPAAASNATARAIAAAQAQRSSSSPVQSSTVPTSLKSTAPSSDQTLRQFYAEALRPSREWYLLLAGILTRAALQGYLTAGWRGTDAVECLFTVGLGMNEKRARSNSRSRGQRSAMGSVSSPSVVTQEGQDGAEDEDEDEDEEGTVYPLDEEEFEEFDPDELPSLVEAVQMLFPGLRAIENGVLVKKSPAEEEFEAELDERLRRFYDIPDSTPDLSTHMEDLAWQYPCEPIERALLRFCEAIAKWRGKPELETYKKKPPRSSTTNTSSLAPLTMESLVHSNPTTPTLTSSTIPMRPQRPPSTRKPSIDLYFLPPENTAISNSINYNTANATNVNFDMSNLGAGASSSFTNAISSSMPSGSARNSQLGTNQVSNPQAAQLWSVWNKRTRSPDNSRAGPSTKRSR